MSKIKTLGCEIKWNAEMQALLIRLGEELARIAAREDDARENGELHLRSAASDLQDISPAPKPPRPAQSLA